MKLGLQLRQTVAIYRISLVQHLFYCSLFYLIISKTAADAF